MTKFVSPTLLRARPVPVSSRGRSSIRVYRQIRVIEMEFRASSPPTTSPFPSSAAAVEDKEKTPEPKYPHDTPPKPWGNKPSSNPRFNMIPTSRWEKGIPPVMGAHLLPSGTVAPVSTSSGPGTGAPHLFSYHVTETSSAEVWQFKSSQDASRALAEQVVAAASHAIATRGAFTLAIPGGSASTALGAALVQSKVDCSKWHVFFVDERVVPLSSSESNYKAAHDAWLKSAQVPAAHVHTIREGLATQQAAVEYAGQLLSSTVLEMEHALPVFDCIVLGIGPDGHIASLFPNRAATANTTDLVVPVMNSPKPPAERVTMTLPVLNAARNVLVYVTGKDKASVVQRIFEVQALPGALPAQLIRPSKGRLTWLLDEAASGEIHPETWAEGKDFPRSEYGKKKAE